MHRPTRVRLARARLPGRGSRSIAQLTSDLLGFDEPTGNTYGSIATVDYLLESVSARAGAAGRARPRRPGSAAVVHARVRLPAACATASCRAAASCRRSATPWRSSTPVRLPARRSAQAAAIVTTVHNTPFGDIVDTEDDLQPLVASMFRDAQRAVALVGGIDSRNGVRRAAVAGATRRRAGRRSTELADRLVRDHDMPFSKAHAIAAAYLSGDVTGDGLRNTLRAELASITSARHFVEVRRTHGRSRRPSRRSARSAHHASSSPAIAPGWMEFAGVYGTIRGRRRARCGGSALQTFAGPVCRCRIQNSIVPTTTTSSASLIDSIDLGRITTV